MRSNHKYTFVSTLCLVLLESVLAGENIDVSERLRSVVPAGWDVERQTGTSVITVTRKELIPSKDLSLVPIPSSPAAGEGSLHYARTQGIRAWFYIEPVGTCSDTEYSQRRLQNSNVWAQLAPLRKKIEQIPPKPGEKPSLLSRAPRNEEERSWITAYEQVCKQLIVLPTHHHNHEAFCISFLKSYHGATIDTPKVQEEINGARKTIETVLVPYALQQSPQQ